MTAVALGPKIQELMFKAIKNRKPSAYVDRQQVRLIDQSLFLLQLKAIL